MLCDDLEWEAQEGGGIYVCTYICLWLMHIVVWQKPTQQYRAITLQLKKPAESHMARHGRPNAQTQVLHYQISST